MLPFIVRSYFRWGAGADQQHRGHEELEQRVGRSRLPLPSLPPAAAPHHTSRRRPLPALVQMYKCVAVLLNIVALLGSPDRPPIELELCAVREVLQDLNF